MNPWRIVSPSVTDTERIGAALGAALDRRDLVCLAGDLGAGKTALARGIGRGWGALEPVNSPTFVLMHEHQRQRDQLRLIHLDCYRLERLLDASVIGLEDLLQGEDILLMEWPERVAVLLPPDRLWIELETVDDETRQLTFYPTGAHYLALVERLQQPLSIYATRD